MLKQKRVWIPIVSVLVIAMGCGLFYGRKVANQAPVKIYEPVEVEQPKVETPVEQTPQGHFHADGTFHEGTHEADAPPAVPAVEYAAPPGAATTPNFPPVDPTQDPVEAAYKRLEYIKNNPYAWGGVHSERATELIAELMPPQKSRDHAHGDEVHDFLVELIAQNDPRAGEVIIANMCDGSVGGNMLIDALVVVGPPAVPYILPYFEKGVAEGGYIRGAIFTILGRIGERYRTDLGGIVDHLIIPKLEVIAADEDAEIYDTPAQRRANEALSMLGR